MGTRCLTHVFDTDRKTILVTLYRQFDGYPDGHGEELAQFLEGFKLTNGLGMGLTKEDKVANGMGCLAAQIVAHFKNEPGGIYIYPAGTSDVAEEYVYEVFAQCSDEEYFSGNPKERAVLISVWEAAKYKSGAPLVSPALPAVYLEWLKERRRRLLQGV